MNNTQFYELEEKINRLEDMKRQDQISNMNNRSHQLTSYDNNRTNDSIWQLELDDILLRIERLLRGQKLVRTIEGEIRWEDPTDPEDAIFNEKGTQDMIRFLSMYLNRNTLLSDYRPEQIKPKMQIISNVLIDYLFLNHEQMGWDTPEKLKSFEYVVMAILHMIESAYRRAILGNERKGHKTNININQNQPYMNEPNMGLIGGQNSAKGWSRLLPWGK